VGVVAITEHLARADIGAWCDQSPRPSIPTCRPPGATRSPPAGRCTAVALGAIKIGDFDQYGTQWTTLTDPEGNVFDIGAPHEDQPQ
jgi:hypothetical protein